MTDKEILDLAQDLRVPFTEHLNTPWARLYMISLVRKAVAYERERCAQICEDHFMSDGDFCARQIRSER
jgi:hypothetical protein